MSALYTVYSCNIASCHRISVVKEFLLMYTRCSPRESAKAPRFALMAYLASLSLRSDCFIFTLLSFLSGELMVINVQSPG